MPETTGTIMDFDWLLELLIGWVQNIQKSKLLSKISIQSKIITSLSASKNQLNSSIYFGDTADFTILWPKFPRPIQDRTYKTQSHFIISFWRYCWFENPAIWLAESISAHITRTRFFQNWDLYKNIADNKCKKKKNITNNHINHISGSFWTIFGAYFFQTNPVLSCTTLYRFLA